MTESFETQLSFKDLPLNSKMVPLLLAISKDFRELNRRRLIQINIHAGQDRLLLILSEGISVRVNELASFLGVQPPSITNAVNRLVERGLVLRHHDETDRRAKLISITKSGLQAQSQINVVLAELEKDMREDLGDENWEKAARALETVSKRLAAASAARLKPGQTI